MGCEVKRLAEPASCMRMNMASRRMIPQYPIQVERRAGRYTGVSGRFVPPVRGRASGLTAREREIVQLIAEGKSNKEMAEILGISVKTVETHRAAIMRKLKLDSMAALVRYAVRNGIMEA